MIALSLIICEDKCKDCEINFLKDPCNSGDYTTEGKLQRFCPDCGQMLPFLPSIRIGLRVKPTMSNGTKRKIGVILAKKHQLDYRQISSLVKSLRNLDEEKDFLSVLSSKLKEEFDLNLTVSQMSDLLVTRGRALNKPKPPDGDISEVKPR